MGRVTDAIGQVMGKVKGARQEVTGGSGIFARLSKEHGEITAMLGRVAASGQDSDARREVYPKLRHDLLSHVRAEEKEIYSALRDIPELTEKMKHSVEEHHEIERAVAELDRTSMSDERWTEIARGLMKTVQEHVREEEGDIFPVGKKAFGEGRAEELEGIYLKAKDRELEALG